MSDGVSSAASGVYTFIVGKPRNLLKSGCTTIRDYLVLVFATVYICIYFMYSDRDYLECNLQFSNEKTKYLAQSNVITPGDGSTVNTSDCMIYNEDGKFSVLANLPYITNECKAETWWPGVLTLMFYLYLFIMFFTRRTLEHFLDIKKSAVLERVGEMDYEEPESLLRSDVDTKKNIIRDIRNEVEGKKRSFFTHGMLIILPVVGHLLILFLLLYTCYRFSWFDKRGKFVIPFVCQNPGMSFPNKRTIVKCSFDKDRLSGLKGCLRTAFCYVAFDGIVAGIDVWRKRNVWRSLGKQFPSAERDVDKLILKNLSYIVGCRRDGRHHLTTSPAPPPRHNRNQNKDEADDLLATLELPNTSISIDETGR